MIINVKAHISACRTMDGLLVNAVYITDSYIVILAVARAIPSNKLISQDKISNKYLLFSGEKKRLNINPLCNQNTPFFTV